MDESTLHGGSVAQDNGSVVSPSSAGVEWDTGPKVLSLESFFHSSNDPDLHVLCVDFETRDIKKKRSMTKTRRARLLPNYAPCRASNNSAFFILE